MKLHGMTPDQVDAAVANFSKLMYTGMRQACEAASTFALTADATDGDLTTAIDGLSVMTTQWGDFTTGTLLPELEKISLQAAKAVANPLGNVPTIKTEQFINDMRNMVTDFSSEMWTTAKTALITGVQDGSSIAELASGVADVAKIKEKKAHVIAQTAVIAAINGGEWQQMMTAVKDLDLKGMKEWEATEDEHTRPTHHEADGQRVPIDGHFVVGGSFMLFPGDPSGEPGEVISCRCTTLYDLDMDDEITASTSSPETLSATGLVDTDGLSAAVNVAFNADHPRGKDGRFIKKGVGLPGDVLKSLTDLKAGDDPKMAWSFDEKENFVSDFMHVTPAQWNNIKDEDKEHLQKLVDASLAQAVPGSAKASAHIDDLDDAADQLPDVNLFDPNTALPPVTPPVTPLTTGQSTPIKITHGLIHAKHTPGTVIAYEKSGMMRVKWNGASYDIELKEDDGSWTPSSNMGVKKSKLYATLNGPGLKDINWVAPGKQQTEVSHATPLAAAPPANPIPHPIHQTPVAPWPTTPGLVNDNSDPFATPVNEPPSDGVNTTTPPVPGSPFHILADTGKNGDGYAAPGLWGKYGAAGVMIKNTDENGTERYLMVQRGPGVENSGIWQLAGGAIDSKESPEQGAAREIFEEIGAPQEYLSTMQHKGTHAVAVPIAGKNDWVYSNIAAEAPTMFKPKVDGTETGDAKWLTKDEIQKLVDSGKMHPDLAKELDKVFALYDDNGNNSLNVNALDEQNKTDTLALLQKALDDGVLTDAEHALMSDTVAKTKAKFVNKKQYEDLIANKHTNVPVPASPIIVTEMSEPTPSSMFGDITGLDANQISQLDNVWKAWTKGLMTKSEAADEVAQIKNPPVPAHVSVGNVAPVGAKISTLNDINMAMSNADVDKSAPFATGTNGTGSKYELFKTANNYTVALKTPSGTSQIVAFEDVPAKMQYLGIPYLELTKPISGITPAAPVINTPTPSVPVAPAKTLAKDLTPAQKNTFYQAFKDEKVSFAFSGKKIYESIHAAKLKHAGDPGIAGLSDREMLKVLDIVEAQKGAFTNNNKYEQKVTDWLKTPNGVKAFKEINPAIPGHSPAMAKKVAKATAKKTATPIASITPSEALGSTTASHFTQKQIDDVYDSFKSSPNGTSQQTHKPEALYWNAVKQSQATGLTPGEVLAAVDIKSTQKFHAPEPNKHLYENTVKDWLNTTTGQQTAAQIQAGTWSPPTPVKKATPSYGGSSYSSGGGSYTHPANTPLSAKIKNLSGGVPPYDSNDTTKYPVISTHEAGNLWTEMQTAHGDMTGTQKASLRYYTGNDGYSLMNRYLRGKQGATDAVFKHVQQAQAGMKPTTKPIVLHRGSGWFTSGLSNQEWTSYANIKALEGGTFHNESFFSASVGGHAAFGGHIKFEIECPIGTPMAYVKAFSKYGGENEMLLAGDVTFQILNVENKNGTVHVRMRAIAPESGSGRVA